MKTAQPALRMYNVWTACEYTL